MKRRRVFAFWNSGNIMTPYLFHREKDFTAIAIWPFVYAWGRKR